METNRLEMSVHPAFMREEVLDRLSALQRADGRLGREHRRDLKELWALVYNYWPQSAA